MMNWCGMSLLGSFRHTGNAIVHTSKLRSGPEALTVPWKLELTLYPGLHSAVVPLATPQRKAVTGVQIAKSIFHGIHDSCEAPHAASCGYQARLLAVGSALDARKVEDVITEDLSGIPSRRCSSNGGNTENMESLMNRYRGDTASQRSSKNEQEVMEHAIGILRAAGVNVGEGEKKPFSAGTPSHGCVLFKTCPMYSECVAYSVGAEAAMYLSIPDFKM